MTLRNKSVQIGKVLLVTFIGFLGVLLFSHFAIKFGVEAGSIKAFFEDTWLYWFCFRVMLYVSSSILLYKAYQKAQSETLRQSYKRFVRIGVMMILATEFTVFVQLIRG